MYLCHGTDGRGQRLLQQAARSEQSRSMGEPRGDLLAAKYLRSSEWYVWFVSSWKALIWGNSALGL